MRPSYQDVIDHEAYFGKADGFWTQVEAKNVKVERPMAAKTTEPYNWVDKIYVRHAESVVDPGWYDENYKPPPDARAVDGMAEITECSRKRAQELKKKGLYLGIADRPALDKAAKQPGNKFDSANWKLPPKGRTVESRSVDSLGRAGSQILRHGYELSDSTF